MMVGVVHIGKAAKVAGVSVDTIRFYQKLGLIKSAGRSAGGYRLFDGKQIRDLTFVRHAWELGFSLIEIKELLALRQKQAARQGLGRICSRKPFRWNSSYSTCSRDRAELGKLLNRSRSDRARDGTALVVADHKTARGT